MLEEIARLEWNGEETQSERDLLHSSILDTNGLVAEYEGTTMVL